MTSTCTNAGPKKHVGQKYFEDNFKQTAELRDQKVDEASNSKQLKMFRFKLKHLKMIST